MAPTQHTENSKRMFTALTMCLMLALIALPDLAFAQMADTGAKVCGFFSSINNILNMTSIGVVTAAVVFSGYQIAFAHKRIGDVAPILIGGVLIGAAGQIANMVVGKDTQQCTPATTMVIQYLFNRYA